MVHDDKKIKFDVFNKKNKKKSNHKEQVKKDTKGIYDIMMYE